MDSHQLRLHIRRWHLTFIGVDLRSPVLIAKSLSQVSPLSREETSICPVMNSRCLSADSVGLLGHLLPSEDLCLPRGRPTDLHQTSSSLSRFASSSYARG